METIKVCMNVHVHTKSNTYIAYRGEANYIALLLSDLPESLREEVLLSDLQETIENVPWFANTDPRFLKKLASNMIVYQHSPGDFIMYHGDIHSEMYCVKKGIVEVLSEDLSHVVAKIGPGGYFGEVCESQNIGGNNYNGCIEF